MIPNIIFLKPGQLFVTCSAETIHTVLGSCIAVCLWDTKSGCGGVNHFMLPQLKTDTPSLKYGDYATRTLISKVKTLSGISSSSSLIAKVFGGANVVNQIAFPIGENNIKIAKEILTEHAVYITAEDTGGTRHRKLVFNSGNGQVRLFTGKKPAQPPPNSTNINGFINRSGPKPHRQF